MMLLYGSSLRRATGSFLWDSVQLTFEKRPFKPWRGQVTQQTSQKNSVPTFCFSTFSGLKFPQFPWVLPAKCRAQSESRHQDSRIDAKRGHWILNWHWFKPGGYLAPINFKTPEDADRQSLGVCWTLRNHEFQKFSKLSCLTQWCYPGIIACLSPEGNTWSVTHFGAYFSVLLILYTSDTVTCYVTPPLIQHLPLEPALFKLHNTLGQKGVSLSSWCNLVTCHINTCLHLLDVLSPT